MRALLIGVSLLALTVPVAHAQQTRPAAVVPPPAAGVEGTQFLVFFDWDRATLTPEARRIIANAADEFKRTGGTRIVATGYTDLSGSAAYNLRLSERRADAVKAELVRLGVPANVITTIGRGEADPLVPTADGVREAQNRRVQIVIPKPPAPPPAPKPVVAAPPPPPPPPPAPKNWEARLGGFYGFNLEETDRNSDLTSHLGGAEIGVGYNVLPFLQIGVEQAGWNTFDTSADDGWGGRSALGLDFGLPMGVARPYLGLNFGGIYGKGVQDGLVAGPELGLKLDFSEKVFGYARTAYDFQFMRSGWDEGLINAGIGAGVKF